MHIDRARLFLTVAFAVTSFTLCYFAFYFAANAGWFAKIEWIDNLAGR